MSEALVLSVAMHNISGNRKSQTGLTYPKDPTPCSECKRASRWEKKKKWYLILLFPYTFFFSCASFHAPLKVVIFLAWGRKSTKNPSCLKTSCPDGFIKLPVPLKYQPFSLPFSSPPLLEWIQMKEKKKKKKERVREEWSEENFRKRTALLHNSGMKEIFHQENFKKGKE